MDQKKNLQDENLESEYEDDSAFERTTQPEPDSNTHSDTESVEEMLSSPGLSEQLSEPDQEGLPISFLLMASSERGNNNIFPADDDVSKEQVWPEVLNHIAQTLVGDKQLSYKPGATGDTRVVSGITTTTTTTTTNTTTLLQALSVSLPITDIPDNKIASEESEDEDQEDEESLPVTNPPTKKRERSDSEEDGDDQNKAQKTEEGAPTFGSSKS